ncbi:MAG TPA: hypothetical protein VE870_12765 [Bacteroidales bacterium]|nr:hypothetical protein [Bacteroidales bacterium]
MRTIKFVFGIILLGYFGTATFSQFSGQDSRDKVLEEFTGMTAGWQHADNSNDTTKPLPYYSEDARYISSHMRGLELAGRDNALANFQNGINMGGQIDSFEILQMNDSEDLATLLCKYQVTIGRTTVIGKNLMVPKKSGSVWRNIMHMTVI